MKHRAKTDEPGTRGKGEPVQPTPEDQSGSTGRPTDTHERGRATDTGQGRYGQSGHGGDSRDRETAGQARYRKSTPDGGEQPDPDSNPGSGRPDVDPHDDQNSRKRDGKP